MKFFVKFFLKFFLKLVLKLFLKLVLKLTPVVVLNVLHVGREAISVAADGDGRKRLGVYARYGGGEFRQPFLRDFYDVLHRVSLRSCCWVL